MPSFLSICEAMVELSGAAQAEGSDMWRLGFAGDTLNTAWYARACLPDTWQVEYLTRLGADPFSTRMLGFLAENRIGTSFIRRDDKRSVGLYAIHLDKGERSFTYWRGQSAARLLADDPAVLDAAFDSAEVIYLSGITLAILTEDRRAELLARLEQARRAGKTTAFDPNLRPALWESPAALSHWTMATAKGAVIVLPSFDDEAQAFGDASPEACARRWQSAGAEEVAVKNGGGAMVTLDATGLHRIELPRAQPVDSTGAGDSFNAGYLAARLAGLPCPEAARKGHEVALQVIARHGALQTLTAG